MPVASTAEAMHKAIRVTKVKIPENISKSKVYATSLALWKHQVNLLLQSFRSVSSDLHQC